MPKDCSSDKLCFTFNFVEVLSIYNKMDRIDPTEEMPIRQYRPRLVKQVHTSLDYKPGFYNQMDYKQLNPLVEQRLDPNLLHILNDQTLLFLYVQVTIKL